MGKPSIGRTEATIYCSFLLLCGVVYHFVSDGAYSGLVTLASAMHCMAFALLHVAIARRRVVTGVSLASLQMAAAAYVMRLTVTIFFSAYRPADSTGNHVYQLMDVAGLGALVLVLTGLPRSDFEKQTAVAWLVGAGVVMGALTYAQLSWRWYVNLLWMAALWVDTLSMLPQVRLTARMEVAHGYAAHYVACATLARIVGSVFWISVYDEFSYEVSWNYPGYSACFAFLVQVVLGSDFLVRYLIAATKQVLENDGGSLCFAV
mmetsp:Transcript_17578/g.40432  ORF Transcript_17578/g.40432 Transcript_17578/m.40432 type:complete len:262 (-) Transcript_17578:66-851(-)|eukprot:CAMPEP_0204265134 /NCGR_PEP_ID=MMETSP0468-20130131/9476_1 /ASSEMBLY_ACC=CAM_ASM_000383 /TAXON_ID=2969 /ORGANISM="Oxyrrhis marina" /LENGTH=261 /DNA_ID=CAMNT_0051240057 /DNA_START=126 /DNA_END=911 /DNA_ORIENTATION=-